MPHNSFGIDRGFRVDGWRGSGMVLHCKLILFSLVFLHFLLQNVFSWQPPQKEIFADDDVFEETDATGKDINSDTRLISVITFDPLAFSNSKL